MRLRTLVVCEKPSAAARVAQAIDEENIPRRLKSQGVTYFECGTRQGPVIVCSVLGHLYSVDSKGTGKRSYPIWDNSWKPKSEVKRSYSSCARWINVIESLSRHVDHFVNACDYDTEGSLIGYTVLKYACRAPLSQSSRMIFSTMTDSELKLAFKNAASGLRMPLVEAARCRHELDWLYGINLSRMLTDSVLKANAGYTTLSTGRVQGPTLRFVVEREKEIACFVPTPFWTIETQVQAQDKSYPVDYFIEKVLTLQQADQVAVECKGRLLTVREVEMRTQEQKPPYPLDLSGLQSEAFRHFGYTPARTVALAEGLYLDALISYPRTGSQKLPASIGFENILQELSTQEEYRDLASMILSRGKLWPTQGMKDDPAHPAIHPTGVTPARLLHGPEAKVYDLIIRRFLAAFTDSAIHQVQQVSLELGQHVFYMHGSVLEKSGWIDFYKPYASVVVRQLPKLDVGDKVPITDIRNQGNFTQPPSRYGPLSLLRKMEEASIGTKSTRSEIIETLYKRGYVTDSRMRATLLAMTITGLLEKYCKLIVDAGFTASLEEAMEKIQRGETTRRIVLVEAIQHLRQVMLDLVERGEALGSQLGSVISKQRLVDSSFKTPCPICGGTLRIAKNWKTGKRFIGCSQRWDKNCRFTLPLPQFGGLSILDRTCKECGFQMVQTRSKKGGRMVSCPRCYSRQHGGVTDGTATNVKRTVGKMEKEIVT